MGGTTCTKRQHKRTTRRKSKMYILFATICQCLGNERTNQRMATILVKRFTRVDPRCLCFYFVGHQALARAHWLILWPIIAVIARLKLMRATIGRAKKLKDVIINAATMKPMFGDTRPPLIICDEIDGGDESAIKVVCKIVEDATKFYAKKKKQKNK